MAAPVKLEIRLEDNAPPRGSVRLLGETASEAEHRFVGWLGLLRALSDGFAARDGGGQTRD